MNDQTTKTRMTKEEVQSFISNNDPIAMMKKKKADQKEKKEDAIFKIMQDCDYLTWEDAEEMYNKYYV